MSWKRLSHQVLHAPSTMGVGGLGDPQNVNFLDFFWHFHNCYIKWSQKMLGEQGNCTYPIPTVVPTGVVNDTKCEMSLPSVLVTFE